MGELAVVNHMYDATHDQTRCGEEEGVTAFHVSCEERVTCPECRQRLTPEEREIQWYPFTEDEETA